LPTPKKAAAKPTADPLLALADELGQLEKDLAPHAGKIARRESLRREIRLKTPLDRSEIAGEQFLVRLGEPAEETVIDFPALANRIGFEKFAQFATASQKTLLDHVKPGIIAQYLKKEPTGTRSLKVFERGQIA